MALFSVLASMASPGGTRAAEQSRLVPGYQGTFAGAGQWLFYGTIAAGETAAVTASGSQSYLSEGDTTVGWVCGNSQGGRDWIGGRLWIVAPGPTASAT